MSALTGEGQFVTFSLDRQVFAVPVGVVREILDHDEPARLPQGPNFLLGLKDVRGQGVPVIDLRLKLGMEPTVRTQDTRILVLDVPLGERSLPLGLVADKVFEVATFDLSTIGPPPEVGVSWPSDYIAGVILKEQGFVVIVDLARLFTQVERDAVITSPIDLVA
ncbi:chemotaxis protein CheW (plasmid) [Neorhizobium sp. SOG26]|jgi:Chemotaxis signal transduction protein|uniref:Chemotaxis protein CheW n=1 Tax=Neorhizobium turbinariae TaxID=2937795 RepID=A0ABT0IPU1_9HYPH|nr:MULTISPECIES: chemotaxis protein CheW [Neorhizobium]AXV17489.1 chemotaxis protein CheW [Neorhizobium sp. SOG26]MCK8779844.1 chemotaxis protein CheW [Neorhizobium turbinariae]